MRRLHKALRVIWCTLILTAGGGFMLMTCQAQESDGVNALPQALVDSYYTGQNTAAYQYFNSAGTQGFLNSMIGSEADSFLDPVWDYKSFAKVRVLDQNFVDLQQDGALYTCVFTENHKNGYVIVRDGEKAPYLYDVDTNTPDLYDIRAQMPEINEGLREAGIDLSTAKASRVIIQNQGKKDAAQAVLITDDIGGRYVYYFNDPASQAGSSQDSQTLSDTYRGFLDGTVSAVAADWYQPGSDDYKLGKLEKGKAYTLKQLEDVILPEYTHNPDNLEKWREKYKKDKEYALIDSENDSETELAVRLNHIGIDSWDDDDTSTVTLILKESGGKLLLCDAFSTWSRSDTTQYYYGFRENGGSGGADDHAGCVSFIDKNGKKRILYEWHTVGEDWIAEINQKAFDNYNKIYNFVYPLVLQIEVDTIGDQDYYSYYAEYSEDEQQKAEEQKMVQAMVSCFNDQGIRFSTPEELQKAYDARKQALGIKEEWCQRKELEWHKISVDCP